MFSSRRTGPLKAQGRHARGRGSRLTRCRLPGRRHHHDWTSKRASPYITTASFPCRGIRKAAHPPTPSSSTMVGRPLCLPSPCTHHPRTHVQLKSRTGDCANGSINIKHQLSTRRNDGRAIAPLCHGPQPSSQEDLRRPIVDHSPTETGLTMRWLKHVVFDKSGDGCQKPSRSRQGWGRGEGHSQSLKRGSSCQVRPSRLCCWALHRFGMHMLDTGCKHFSCILGAVPIEDGSSRPQHLAAAGMDRWWSDSVHVRPADTSA